MSRHKRIPVDLRTIPDEWVGPGYATFDDEFKKASEDWWIRKINSSLWYYPVIGGILRMLSNYSLYRAISTTPKPKANFALRDADGRVRVKEADND